MLFRQYVQLIWSIGFLRIHLGRTLHLYSIAWVFPEFKTSQPTIKATSSEALL